MTAGETTGLPWATLDPAANARALMDIQLRGLQAAGQVVERLVRATDGDGATSGGATSGGAAGEPGQSSTGQSAIGIDGLVDLWATMTKGWLRAMGRMSPQASTTNSTTNGTGAAAADRVDVGIHRPGPGCTLLVRPGSDAELWLHNGTDADVYDIRLSCSNLICPSGGTLKATTITFEPPVVDILPKRSSRGVLVRAARPPKGPRAAEPYRGVIVATGSPDLWVPVEVIAADHP